MGGDGIFRKTLAASLGKSLAVDRELRLSDREREIVFLAATGHTDTSIAHQLGISTATIGTYWNRIRGKVGPYSRTEIVAVILMHESQRKIDEMRSSCQKLIEQIEADSTPWKAIVQNAPDAILVVDSDGIIQLANPEAERLFGYDDGELLDSPLAHLLVSTIRAEHAKLYAEYFLHPTKKRMAEHKATVALRKNGTEIMIAADLNGFESGDKSLVACIIRPVMD